jgi:hypothetical protein
MTIEDVDKIRPVLARWRDKIMAYPHVQGVGIGKKRRKGKDTGQMCIVVYVDKKFPINLLKESERLPREIEGVSVDVVESGKFRALNLENKGG